jgi:hypothetical protein
MAGGYLHDRYILHSDRVIGGRIARHCWELFLCAYVRVFLAMAYGACYLGTYRNGRGGMVAKTLFGQIKNLIRLRPLLQLPPALKKCGQS